MTSERTAELEGRLAEVDRLLGDPTVVADPRRMQELGKARDAAEQTPTPPSR